MARRQKKWFCAPSSQMLIHSSRAIEVIVVSRSQLLVNQARVAASRAASLEKLREAGVSPRADRMPSIRSRMGLGPFQELFCRV